jgi:hypothetical protein
VVGGAEGRSDTMGVLDEFVRRIRAPLVGLDICGRGELCLGAESLLVKKDIRPLTQFRIERCLRLEASRGASRVEAWGSCTLGTVPVYHPSG